jgi:hypothetical protein
MIATEGGISLSVMATEMSADNGVAALTTSVSEAMLLDVFGSLLPGPRVTDAVVDSELPELRSTVPVIV